MKKSAKFIISIMLVLIMYFLSGKIPAIRNLMVEENLDWVQAAISLAAGGIVLLISCCIEGFPSKYDGLAKKYSDYVAGAFVEKKDARQRKKLMKAVEHYDYAEYAEAIQKLEDLLPQCKNDRDYCAVQSMAAMAHYKNGQTDKAVEVSKAAAERADSRKDLWDRLAAFQMAAAKFEDAVESWKKEMQCGSPGVRPCVKIADLRLKQKKYAEAEEYAQKAVDINSREKEPYRILSIVCRALGKEEESRTYYNKFKNLGGDTAALDAELAAIKK